MSFWPSMSTRPPVFSCWIGSGCDASFTVVSPVELDSARARAATPPSSNAFPATSSISNATPSTENIDASATNPSSAILFPERSSCLRQVGAPDSSAHSGTTWRDSRPQCCS